MVRQQRNTRQRKLVLDTVLAHRDHPSVDLIYLAVRGEDDKISRGTVYRNLHLLVENGDIQKIKIPGADRFDWRLEPHYHIACVKCGAIVDAPIPYREDLDARVSEASGFKEIHHRLIFDGICPECQK